MIIFGEIKPVDIREIWKNEATDFTPWLVDNIEHLGNPPEMELEVQDREADVGEFSLDILAKDLGTGRTVIIENQLDGTNHDHLGRFYIDLQEKDRNKKLFDLLQAQQGQIEQEFGEALTWERLDDKRACRIAAYRDGRIEEPMQVLNEIRDWSIANLLKLKKVLLPKANELLDQEPE